MWGITRLGFVVEQYTDHNQLWEKFKLYLYEK